MGNTITINTVTNTNSASERHPLALSVEQAAKLRAQLIASGHIRPHWGKRMLPLDKAGHAAAIVHIAEYNRDHGMRYRAFEGNMTPDWFEHLPDQPEGE